VKKTFIFTWFLLGRVLVSVPADMPPPAEFDLAETFAGFGVEEIVFSERPYGVDGHWYANFAYYAKDASAKTYLGGSRLCKLDVASGNVAELLADPGGTIRDPVVHYDGKTILFSYRKADEETCHLYEIQADGSGLTQLTFGRFDDLEPTYLPDGGIMFVSGRGKRWVQCWLTQVATLHRCDRDGKNIREISANVEQDNTPWVLPDGRVVYQRWEYIDRSQVNYHHLWASNPDGTGQMVYFGNMHPGEVYIDAKPIPGTDKVVLINSPGHGSKSHAGNVAILDNPVNPDDKASLKNLTKWDRKKESGYRDPWAFSEGCIMVARDKELLLMDGQGRTKQIFQGLEMVHEPRPLIKRKLERVIPSRIDPSKTTGTLMLQNVYVGRNMEGIKPGSIKKLLIMETLPKPINYTGGMAPMSSGGTFSLERVLGTVPVEADGSAYFEVPANRSLILAALDENNSAVKRMQSFLSVVPGEVTSCIGCHENRDRAPANPKTRKLLATQHAPSRIQPLEGVPEILDFPRDIQPILDRHCVKCHNPDQPEAGVQLAGDRTPIWSLSYYTLTSRGQFKDGRNQAKSNYPPFVLWDYASPLMKKIDGSHHDVKVSDLERETIRTWINLGAPYPGTYAALGSGMVGGYEQNKIQQNDLAYPEVKAMAQAIDRRCGECHSKKNNPLPRNASHESLNTPWEKQLGYRLQRHMVYNLTRPEKSTLLMAPLAVEAGGYAGQTNGAYKCAAVFEGTDDSDYQTILAGIEKTKWLLDEIKRFDMPGFRPRKSYVREMVRYGILPHTVRPEDVTDVYDVDRRYWESLWYYPPGQEPRLHQNPVCIPELQTDSTEPYRPES
jgi:hypothetical protein